MTRLEDDPLAVRSPLMVRVFDGVMQRQMRSTFRAVRVARPGVPALPSDRPVVFFSNHPSWWDPAFFIVLTAALLPGRASFGPMEASALERYRFMRRIGIFGIAPGTAAGATRLLRAGRRILSEPCNILWLTAQGSFADPRTPIVLQPGLSRLLAREPHAMAVPLALEYPFWSEKRPEALAAFGDPIPAAEALKDRLESALQDTVDGLAVCARARDPAAFEVILEGRVGIGGIYGSWSRLRARLSGHGYRPEHLPDAPE